MHSHRENLLEGDIAPHMWRLAVPMMWGLFAMTSFGIVDTLYISRLGTTALAALGFTMPMVMFYMGIIFGLSIGTTSVLSRAYGEGDFDKVRRLATDSLVMATIIIASAAMARSDQADRGCGDRQAITYDSRFTDDIQYCE